MKSREPPTSDSKLVKSSLTHITENYGQSASYTGDRGFGSPEGRISLFKKSYLETSLRSKGYANRKTRIEWCILGHNLWKLATLAA